MKIRARSVAWAAALILAACPACRASAPSAAGPLLIPESRSPGESASQPGVYDAGALDPIENNRIEHTFILRNPRATPVTVDSLTSSCGCTTAIIEVGDRPQALPLTLPPGASARIRVEVDVEGEAIGNVAKFVWIHTRGYTQPAAVLEVKATFAAIASLTPSTIDFGRVHVGEGRKITVYAAISPRLLAAHPNITLASPLPYLTVGLPTVAATAPAPAGASSQWTRLAYTVSLAANAPIGAFATDLNMELTSDGPMSQVIRQALEEDYLVVRGEVYGDISVAPRSVTFGTVGEGAGSTRDATVSAASPAILAQVQAQCDSPWVTVQPSDDGLGSRAGASREYAVSVSPSAPPGALAAQVTFTTSSGQTLIVPVTAFISGDERRGPS